MRKSIILLQLIISTTCFGQTQTPIPVGFNFWTSLLAILASLSLVLGVALLFGKSRFTAGEKYLALILFSFGITLISFVLFWTGYGQFYPQLQNVWPFLTFLVGPSLYFYLKNTFQDTYSRADIFWHYLLPALVGLLTFPAILTDFGIQNSASKDFFNLGTAAVLMIAHLVFYAQKIWQIAQNEWQVDNNIRIWTRVISCGMVAYMFGFLSYFMLIRCSFFSFSWDYAISFVMASGILAIGYMGFLQKRVFRSEPIANFIPVQKYKTSMLTESTSATIRRRMEQLLTEQEVFKENELRLADLAAYLDVSYHALSQVINEHYGINFFELINNYRLEHVKKMLENPKYEQYTILQIAYEAGFNNKASFNRYFKKAFGLTPSAYRLKISVE